jgi:hypothetical protein
MNTSLPEFYRVFGIHFKSDGKMGTIELFSEITDFVEDTFV